MTEQVNKSEPYIVPKIDPKVFLNVRTTVINNPIKEILKETPIVPIIIAAKGYPEIPQGIEIYYQNIPYPRKGMPDAEILYALNMVKRDTMILVSTLLNKYFLPSYIFLLFYPWSWKVDLANTFLLHYIRKTDQLLKPWYYQPTYYCPFVRELQDFFRFFLRGLGLRKDITDDTARFLIQFLEHDDAYRVVVQDLFTEMKKEQLINNPRKEILRISKVLQERDKTLMVKVKIESLIKTLYWLLLHPRIKREFIKAVKLTNFEKLRFDEGDKYWALSWRGYDANGESMEERRNKLEKLHKGVSIPKIKLNYG